MCLHRWSCAAFIALLPVLASTAATSTDNGTEAAAHATARASPRPEVAAVMGTEPTDSCWPSCGLTTQLADSTHRSLFEFGRRMSSDSASARPHKIGRHYTAVSRKNSTANGSRKGALHASKASGAPASLLPRNKTRSAKNATSKAGSAQSRGLHRKNATTGLRTSARHHGHRAKGLSRSTPAPAPAAVTSEGSESLLLSTARAIGVVLAMLASLGAGTCLLWFLLAVLGPKRVDIETD